MSRVTSRRASSFQIQTGRLRKRAVEIDGKQKCKRLSLWNSASICRLTYASDRSWHAKSPGATPGRGVRPSKSLSLSDRFALVCREICRKDLAQFLHLETGCLSFPASVPRGFEFYTSTSGKILSRRGLKGDENGFICYSATFEQFTEHRSLSLHVLINFKLVECEIDRL